MSDHEDPMRPFPTPAEADQIRRARLARLEGEARECIHKAIVSDPLPNGERRNWFPIVPDDLWTRLEKEMAQTGWDIRRQDVGDQGMKTEYAVFVYPHTPAS